jgi:chemotaxis receptor (MCP) glutamine deamidase CheD
MSKNTQHAAQLGNDGSKEIRVGVNECRLARNGERIVARGILADVVVTIQVPSAGFAAMLRFSVPDEASASNLRPGAHLEFVEQSLALVLESIRSMDLPGKMTVRAIGGAAVDGAADLRGKQLVSEIETSLGRQGVIVSGSDLGGTQRRSIWLESSSGRLIVRSVSIGNTSKWQTPMPFPVQDKHDAPCPAPCLTDATA